MVDSFLGRKYKVDHASSVNFDAYMRALGVGTILRTLGNTVVATYILTKEGDVYTLTSTSTFKDYTVSFKLGQEIEYETPDSRKVKATFTVDGNKLIEVQRGEKTSTLVREFSDEAITITASVDDVVATRVYKKTG